MKKEKPEPPRVIRADHWKVQPDAISPGCTIASMVHGEKQHLGLYFMPPGIQTNLFSLEDHDDRTSEEWYGPCDEFYYVLVGEFTMFWGDDAEAVKTGRSEKMVLTAGDLGYWARGWKYSVRNTGNTPGTFLWGLTFPEEGTPRREYTWTGKPDRPT